MHQEWGLQRVAVMGQINREGDIFDIIDIIDLNL